MNKIFKKHKNDLILIGVILSLALTLLLILKLTAKNGKTVKVIVDGKEEYTYNLSEDIETKILTDGNKQNTLVIKDGKAFVESADCPDKICVSHRAISNVGETIVCLPHKVVISVE